MKTDTAAQQKAPALVAWLCLPGGGMYSGDIAAPANLSCGLVIHAVEQVQLAVHSRENPQNVVVAGDRGGGIECRRLLLSSYAGNQSSGKEVARGSVEAGDSGVL